MKLNWSNIKAATRGLDLIIVAAILMATISGVQYYLTKRSIENEARQMAEIRLRNANLLLESAMSSMETAVLNVSRFVEESIYDKENLPSLTRGMLEANPTVKECGLLFAPGHFPDSSVPFHPATFRNEDGVLSTMDQSTNGFNYYTRQWYKDVEASGESLWTDPYLSMTDDKMVCTFSVPLRDSTGRFAGVMYADISMEWLYNLLKEGASPYKNAFSVILNKLGKSIVETRAGGVPPGNEELVNDMVAMKSGEARISYSDTSSRAFYAPIGKYGWSMAIICPEKEMFDDFYDTVTMLTIFMLLGLALLGFIMYRIAKWYRKLQSVEQKKQRIESELNVAHKIQLGMIQHDFPPYPERKDLDIYASLDAAKEVGGDLYDFFLSSGKLWFCIGDVSGKGVPAALVMAVTRSLFRSEAVHGDSPAVVMKSINNTLTGMNESEMFVTTFIGKLDLATGRLDFCNAGHNHPVIIGEGGPSEMQVCSNLPLGLIRDFPFKEERTELPAESTIFLYTDGLTEAENQDKELFGTQRMKAVLQKGGTPEELIKATAQAVSGFTSGAEQNDDLTMLAIAYHGHRGSHVVIKNELSGLSVIPELIGNLGLGREISDKLNLALEEAATNSILYAYDSPGSGNVDIGVITNENVVEMTLKDWGKPFDPTSAKEPDLTVSGMDRPVGGLGIFLVRKLMDKVEYERKDGMNILKMTKNIQ